MALKTVRYSIGNSARWGVVKGDGITPIEGDYATTRDFMLAGAAAARAAAGGEATCRLAEAEVLAPITANQQFLCQAINYYSHMRESGFDPEKNPFNIFFRKASSCIAPADTPIVCPPHVEFLDYEVEIGVVFSSDVDGPRNVGEENLGDFIGGLVLLNDVSARDVQLPEMQFYKGKSYRTFGPAGPFLTLVDAGDLARFEELRLTLSVNGKERQNSLASDMIHKPAPTLTELSGLQDWQAGDVLATGTPGGCALQAPPKPLAMIAQLVAAATRQKMLRRLAGENPRRLRAGDEIVTTVRTDDGTLDLGVQRNKVVAG